MKRLTFIISALVLCLGLTACGSGEKAQAPSVAENDKAAVQERLGKDSSADAPGEDTQEDPAETPSEDGEQPSDSGTNILVAYFSRADENYSVGTIDVGNTQIIAEYIAAEVGADSFHIETVTPYPAGYDDCCDVAKQELNDKARPELTGTVDLEQYDIVFLGYPIWWGDLPMAVYTFMESYDWSEKIVIPFNTHEGSGSSRTYDAIAQALPDAMVLEGMAIQGKTAQEFSDDTRQSVRDWLDGLGF